MKMLSYVKMFVLTMVLTALTTVAFAQTAIVIDPNAVISNDQLIATLIKTISSVKGQSALAVGVIVAQLIVAALGNVVFAKVAGKWKLLSVFLLGAFISAGSLMMQGVSFGAALMAGSTLSLLQPAVHQFYVQFVKKGNEGPSA